MWQDTVQKEISSISEKICIGPVILYEIKVWCLKENEMGIFLSPERSMVRAMCGVQLKDSKGAKDLMLILDLNEK